MCGRDCFPYWPAMPRVLSDDQLLALCAAMKRPKYRPSDRSGLRIIRQDGQTLVYQCLAESPARSAGFEAEDRLLKIDGDDVERLSLGAISRRLKREGESVALTAARGDETF